MFGSSEKESAAAFVEGNALHCGVCGNVRFWHRKAQLNTALASFFNLDWLDPSADCYICDRCGYVHWFLKRKQT